MHQLNRLVVESPKLTILIALLITTLLGYKARDFRFDSAFANLYDPNAPNNKYYEKVSTQFGSDDMGVIGVVADNVYDPQTLDKIRRITAEVEKIDGIERVLSLTNVPDIIADPVNRPPLVPLGNLDPATVEALRRKIADNPIYLNVVARDGRGAAILFFFSDRLGADAASQKLRDASLEEVVAREQGPELLYLTGMQHVAVKSLDMMRRDFRTFTPLSLGVVLIVLGLCFRNLRGVLLPVLSVLCGVLWTLGIMVLTGEAITIGTVILPVLLIVIGSTYAIYVLAQYEDEAAKGGDAREVVRRALDHVTVPVTVAALTTVIGFLALLVSRITTIRALGLYSAIGFVSLTAIVLTLMPAILILLPVPTVKAKRESRRLIFWLERIGYFDRVYRTPIMIGAAIVVIPCIWGIAHVRTDLNFIQYFRPSSPIRQANEIIGSRIGGSQVFDVIVDSGKPGGALRFDLLKRIKGLQTYLATLPGIDQTRSLVDYAELFDRALQQTDAGDNSPRGAAPISGSRGDSDGSHATLFDHPERYDGVTRMMLLYKSSLADVMSKDSALARIVVRTRLNSSSDIVRVAEEIRRYGKKHFPPEASVKPTGSLILLNGATDDVVRGQVTSLAFALGVIFGVLWLLFLSFKVAILSLLPNMLAIVLLFGVMGLTGIPLNVGTSVIASIAIGVAVEDAIRYLARLSDETRATDDQDKAIARTISTVGKPIIYASTALGLGFMVFLFSNFVPIQTFGFLTALTVMTALVNDLVLLPALLSTTRIITLWDLLYLKLGKDPHKTIPLFEGLRSYQARIVVLMGELKTLPQGQTIVRRGESGNEMFVLIGGKAEVRLNLDGQSRILAHYDRGEVFGEMGLLRHQNRMADVVATQDAEVLVVNERFLSRMQRRYPRIGARIFLNIAKILSDRLEKESIRA